MQAPNVTVQKMRGKLYFFSISSRVFDSITIKAWTNGGKMVRNNPACNLEISGSVDFIRENTEK